MYKNMLYGVTREFTTNNGAEKPKTEMSRPRLQNNRRPVSESSVDLDIRRKRKKPLYVDRFLYAVRDKFAKKNQITHAY